MIKNIFIVFLVFLNLLLFAKKVTNETSNITKANSYLLLALQIKEESKEKAIEYIRRAEKISLKIKNNSLLKNIYFEEAQIYDYYSEYKKAIEIYKKALIYSTKTNDNITTGKCYLNIGATKTYYGEYTNAIKNYNKSFEFFNKTNDTIYIPKINNNLALIYKNKGDYVKAIEYFEKNLETYIKANNIKSIALTYNNIGVIYLEQKEYKNALATFLKVEELYKKTSDDYSLGEIYNNIGLIYTNKKDTVKAIEYFNKSIVLCKKTRNKKALATSLMNVGWLVDIEGNEAKVKNYYNQSLKIFKEIGYKKGEASILLNICLLQLRLNQNKVALQNAKEGLKIAKLINSINYQIKAYEILIRIYNKLKIYEISVENYKIYTVLKDSMFSTVKNKQINEIIEKYEENNNKEKLELLQFKTKNQELLIENAKHKNYFLTIGLIFVSIIMTLLIYLYFYKQKERRKIIAKHIKNAKDDIIIENLLKQKSVEKYKDSTLNIEQKDRLINELANLLIEEKYFLNHNLTIDNLANQLGTNKAYLSQVINEVYNSNFNNFINKYRIKEARKMLITEEYDKYSLEGIAKLVGFSNRTTFISAFKKYSGITPSVFQKKKYYKNTFLNK